MTRRRTSSLSDSFDAVRVRENSINEEPAEEQRRVRRISMDEKTLEKERSRKMSVSSYITDGRVRRLSSLCNDDRNIISDEIRTRRKSDTGNTNLGIEKILNSPSYTANSSLFIPQKLPKQCGSSIISMIEPMPDARTNQRTENTYRIDDCEYIDQRLVRHLIHTILKEQFEDKSYSKDSSLMGEHVKCATESIKNVMKSLHIRRYKIVANVIVAQNIGQGIIQSSRCLSNRKHDIWVEATFRNAPMIVQGTVYFMYYE